MDALALLCNLHADGPTTLEELHRIGVRALGDVLTSDAPELVRELGWNQAAAERFVREASHLSSRLGETLADPAGAELDDVDLEDDGLQLTGGPEGGIAVGAVSRSEVASGVTASSPRETSRRGGVDEVLRQWRDLDERAPLRAEPRPPEAPPAAATAIGAEVAGALEHGSLERLAEMGVMGLEDLVAADPLELARGLRTGYSRALRVQFLARRSLDRNATAAGSVAIAQPGAPSRIGGPFA